jgi:protein LSM14
LCSFLINFLKVAWWTHLWAQLTHPTQHFTEDFDFTAMNEKFNKDEVWGELGGKGEKGGDEEDEYGDGNLDDDTSDVAFLTKSLSDAPKKAMYVKDDFFDSLSCDALDREEGRSERNRFSEQRKIDTEVVQELCVLCFLFHVQHSVYWLGVP